MFPRTENTTQFKNFWLNQHMCISLDNSPGICWEIYSPVQPRLLDVEEGQHMVVAYLTHPMTEGILEPSKSIEKTMVSATNPAPTIATLFELPNFRLHLYNFHNQVLLLHVLL